LKKVILLVFHFSNGFIQKMINMKAKKTAIIILCLFSVILGGIIIYPRILQFINQENEIVLEGNYQLTANYIVETNEHLITRNGKITFSDDSLAIIVYGRMTGSNTTIEGKIKAYKDAEVDIKDSPHTVFEIYAYDSAQINVNNSTVHKIYAYNQSRITIDGISYEAGSIESTLQATVNDLQNKVDDLISKNNNPVVGILDPNDQEVISGVRKIRASIYDEGTCTIEVLVNGQVVGSILPFYWDTTTVSDGIYNLTVRATDCSMKKGQDQLLVTVDNDPFDKMVISHTNMTTKDTLETCGSTSWVNIPDMSAYIRARTNSILNVSLTFTASINPSYTYEIRFLIDGNQMNGIYQINNNLTTPIKFDLLSTPTQTGIYLINAQWKMNDVSGIFQCNAAPNRTFIVEEWNLPLQSGIIHTYSLYNASNAISGATYNNNIVSFKLNFTVEGYEAVYLHHSGNLYGTLSSRGVLTGHVWFVVDGTKWDNPSTFVTEMIADTSGNAYIHLDLCYFVPQDYFNPGSHSLEIFLFANANNNLAYTERQLFIQTLVP